MYKEQELLQASSAYHRLDKSQNFIGNKAFAQTIINDLKQRQRNTEFKKRVVGLNTNSFDSGSNKMTIMEQPS